jgi:hypothetical protein
MGIFFFVLLNVLAVAVAVAGGSGKVAVVVAGSRWLCLTVVVFGSGSCGKWQ